jgi:hypothetical protein
MAEIEREVRKVMAVDRVTINKVPIKPTFPTTQPNLRYMIAPRMVRRDGVKTPPKVPSLVDLILSVVLTGIRICYCFLLAFYAVIFFRTLTQNQSSLLPFIITKSGHFLSLPFKPIPSV